VELTLRSAADGPRLFAEPVKEVESLRRGLAWSAQVERTADKHLADDLGELLELTGDFDLKGDPDFSVFLGGREVRCEAERGKLRCLGVEAPIKPHDGKLQLRLLLDRGSLEVFANGGEVAISHGLRQAAEHRRTGVQVHRGSLAQGAWQVYRLAP
jgi:sucrose-6-phosphate hydrolase SacC (GH32 family)